MRAIQSGRAIGLAAVLGACLFLAGTAHATSDTERAGSILIFAKVVHDSERDTLIQITNTGNMVNRARCFYLNGDSCAVTDFEITLTRQQPTHWRVGDGRAVNLLDGFGTDGAGLDPGRIPPVSEGFAGALVCVEVNADGDPVPMNKIKGEATLLDVSESITQNTSEYNAIAFSGVVRDMNADLELDGTTLPADQREYAACSDRHRVNFYSNPDQIDPVLGSNSSVVTNLTVLPCNLDLTRRAPRDIGLFFGGWDEFETFFSTTHLRRGCWLNVNLNELGIGSSSPFATVDVTATVGGPVMLLGESFHSDLISGATGSAANNIHQNGDDEAAVIKMLVLP
jgi:hypothetical protein